MEIFDFDANDMVNFSNHNSLSPSNSETITINKSEYQALHASIITLTTQIQSLQSTINTLTTTINNNSDLQIISKIQSMVKSSKSSNKYHHSNTKPSNMITSCFTNHKQPPPTIETELPSVLNDTIKMSSTTIEQFLANEGSVFFEQVESKNDLILNVMDVHNVRQEQQHILRCKLCHKCW